jgi:hypothetical protein
MILNNYIVNAIDFWCKILFIRYLRNKYLWFINVAKL